MTERRSRLKGSYGKPCDWMLMQSGRKFWAADPRPGDFDIYDIAAGLASANRFAGQGRYRYSVAQHSVLCSRYVTDVFFDYSGSQIERQMRFDALMHDCSEAYVQDIARPAKQFLPGYYEMEELIMAAASEQFGLTHPLPPAVKQIDNVLLVTEARVLFDGSTPWWLAPEWPEPLPLELVEPWLPEYAEAKFLEAYEELRTK